MQYMDNTGIFSFKEQANKLITVVNNFKRISLDDRSKDRIDIELIKKMLSVLEEVSKFKEVNNGNIKILEYLDELSPFTRENETSKFSTEILRFSEENVNIDENLIEYGLNRFLYFIALIATEISYRHNVIAPNIQESPIKAIVYKMQIFADYYSTTKDKDNETTATLKNYAKYYASRIHVQYNKKIEAIAEEAKKIIPQALEKNAGSLSKVFGKLLFWKKAGKGVIIISLFFMALFLIGVPVLSYMYWWNFSYTDPFSYMMILLGLKILSSITVEVLLIYFFRILLGNYYKIKTEIMQLENRKALSDFLPTYVMFSTFNKDNSIIEQFSKFIFKPLVPNPEDIPKMTDGLETLAKLIGKFRSNAAGQDGV